MLFVRRCLRRGSSSLMGLLTYSQRKTFAKLKSTDCKDFQWNRQAFAKKLDKQIYQYQSNLANFSVQNSEYFNDKGWRVTYIPEKTIFEYSKTQGQHQVKVITYVMNEPPNLQIDGQQLPEQQANKKYAQIGVYIRRIGQQKAFFTEVGVFRKMALMMSTNITDRYMFEWSKTDYFGPNVNAIPKVLKSQMQQFLYYFGLNTQMFINMVLHASLMVDFEDQKWLINLREFWS